MFNSSTNNLLSEPDKSLQSSIVIPNFKAQAGSSLTEDTSASCHFDSVPKEVSNRHQTFHNVNLSERSLSISSSYDNVSEEAILAGADKQTINTGNSKFDCVISGAQNIASQPMKIPIDESVVYEHNKVPIAQPMDVEIRNDRSNAGLILDCSKLLADLEAWRPPSSKGVGRSSNSVDDCTSVHETNGKSEVQTENLSDRARALSVSTSKPPSGMSLPSRRLSSGSQRQTHPVDFDVVQTASSCEDVTTLETTTNVVQLTDSIDSMPVAERERAPADGSESNDVITDFTAMVRIFINNYYR